MVHYLTRRREYERQERVRQGWLALREVAEAMRCQLASNKKKKEREAFLEQYRSQLKGLLAIRSTRDHKALQLYKDQAAHIRKRRVPMEHAVDHLLLCGPNF